MDIWLDMILIVAAIALLWGVMMGIAVLFGGEKDSGGACIVLPIVGHKEDVEFRIREAVSQVRRSGLRGAVIYVADFGTDSETAEIAARMCREFSMTEWVSREELTERIYKGVESGE